MQSILGSVPVALKAPTRLEGSEAKLSTRELPRVQRNGGAIAQKTAAFMKWCEENGHGYISRNEDRARYERLQRLFMKEYTPEVPLTTAYEELKYTPGMTFAEWCGANNFSGVSYSGDRRRYDRLHKRYTELKRIHANSQEEAREEPVETVIAEPSGIDIPPSELIESLEEPPQKSAQDVDDKIDSEVQGERPGEVPVARKYGQRSIYEPGMPFSDWCDVNGHGVISSTENKKEYARLYGLYKTEKDRSNNLGTDNTDQAKEDSSEVDLPNDQPTKSKLLSFEDWCIKEGYGPVTKDDIGRYRRLKTQYDVYVSQLPKWVTGREN